MRKRKGDVIHYIPIPVFTPFKNRQNKQKRRQPLTQDKSIGIEVQ